MKSLKKIHKSLNLFFSISLIGATYFRDEENFIAVYIPWMQFIALLQTTGNTIPQSIAWISQGMDRVNELQADSAPKDTVRTTFLLGNLF